MPVSSRTRRRNSLSHDVAGTVSVPSWTPRSSSVPSTWSGSCWRGGWSSAWIIMTILLTSYLVFLQPSSLFNEFDYQKELLAAFSTPNEPPKHFHSHPSFQVKKNETVSSNVRESLVMPLPLRITVPPTNNTTLDLGVRAVDADQLATTPTSESLATDTPAASKQSIRASDHPTSRYYHTATTVDQVTILYSTTTAAPDSSSLALLASSSRSHAIVYLVQKTHSTYQRDSFGLLLQSLDLLFQHYFDHHPNATSDGSSPREDPLLVWNKLNTTDIYLFHTGDFTQVDLQFLEDRYAPYYNRHRHHRHRAPHHHNDSAGYSRPYASMFRLADLSRSKYWQVPKSLRRENISSWFRYPQFSVGYRHMCSWFAIGIWDFFQKLNQAATVAAAAAVSPQNGQAAPQSIAFNYTYIWRLDEDSFLLSPIRYDIFEFMQHHNYIYGYRLCSYELDYNYYMKGWFDKWHAKTRPRRTIVLENAGICAFYNNFFVAQLAWFQQEPVQQFLKHMRPKIYRMRYGDLLLHTMALYAYANHNDENDNNETITSSSNNHHTQEGIHRFLDFTYQHITYNTTTQCVLYGGIQAGYNDPHATATMHEFYQHQHPLQQNQPCSEPLQRFRLEAQDLSPTYQHLSSSLMSPPSTESNKSNMTLETIVVGRMEIPGKGILSG